MSAPTAHALPTFDITAEGLAEEAADLISYLEYSADKLVASVARSERTFDKVIRPLAAIDNELRARVQYIALFHGVSPCAAIRQASSAAENEVVQAHLALFQRDDLFALVDAVHANPQQHACVDEEDLKLLSRFHQLFIENGMKLTGASRERFTWITRRLVDLRVEFMQNLGADPGSVSFSEGELAGLGVEGFEIVEAGNVDAAAPTRYQVPLTKPVVTRILSQCSVPQTRKEVFLRHQNRYQPNVEIFREIVLLRDEASRLLGFESFAHRKLQRQLVQSPDRVEKWLKELHTALGPLAQRELEQLRAFAKTDAIHLWDLDFYHNRILQEQYQVDHERVAEYFPARGTIERMLGLFEELFSVQFEKVDASGKHTWHADVDAFAVWEADKSAFIGYLYVDIYPRPGKYNHAANFNIYPAYLNSEGKRTPVVTALVCNVSRGGEPALLRHQEVITIFHELGHGMHDLLGQSKYALFHGHRTVADFVEAPSQLLENWCWVPDCLRRLSSHYSYTSTTSPSPSSQPSPAPAPAAPTLTQPRTPKQIPTSLLTALLAAKPLNLALLTLRQIAFSTFDLAVHHPTSPTALQSLDIAATYNRLLEETTGLQGPSPPSPDQKSWTWGHGHVTTAHYVWSQEANYYSYLFTRMLAAEIWESHFQADPMSREAGLAYRRGILEHGGSREEWGLITGLLGREPGLGAYLRELGVEVGEDALQ
ncbi:M3 family metallopeptidase [Aspergillus brunneoviolaceus CBS 621.78]|uniref:Thimet oligopeptidase n=1 Tax=Aspergillus brunneoviolaceus CBS 621.78 TaxID=1450534 RepID=A0ACD1GBT6_9EURO|nr:thimet oligopeptidase [Aspergillus brunneoviolaceus CBS 621.78]RAH46718.1 thimet oligopeptidase [Aspergillus brunneoviolaceus CBS 621.78]